MYAQVLLGATRRPVVRSLLAHSEVNRRVVSRFVAGEDAETALEAVHPLVADGLRISLDHLGEDVTDPVQADDTVAAYRTLVARLDDAGLAAGAEVSVKLSALGQSLGDDGPRRSTDRAFALAEHAYVRGVDVTFDMEDHTTVDHTLESVRELRKEFPRVGCVLQAMLFRTEADARDLARPGARVRLVKGAYAEPATVAYSRKADVELAYVRCLRILAEGGAYPMAATHDTRLMDIAAELFRRSGSEGEFQMLYGIRPSEQRRRTAEGHTVRVYVPFGTDWYAYFTRRLAERPANLAFFARALLSH